MIASILDLYVCTQQYRRASSIFHSMEQKNEMKRRSKIYFPNIMFHYCFEEVEKTEKTFSFLLEPRWCFFGTQRILLHFLLKVQNAFFLFFQFQSIKFISFLFTLLQFSEEKERKGETSTESKTLNWSNVMKDRMEQQNATTTDTKRSVWWNTSSWCCCCLCGKLLSLDP